MSRYLHLTPIQVLKIASRPHPSHISPCLGFMMCVSTQPRPHLTPILMSRFAYHLSPGNVHPWSRSQDLHLTSNQVPSHLHPGCRIRVSAPPRSQLTLIIIWKCAPQLHPYLVPLPFRFLDSCITRYHPGRISPQSRCCLTSFLVQKIASQLHPGPISHSSRSQDVCHTSIQVLSHLHPTPSILILPPPMPCLTSIRVKRFCITALSMCYLTPIQVSILASEFHPGHVLHPSRS